MEEYFEWEGGFDKNLILSKLANARKANNGECSFNATEYAYWFPVLKSAIWTANCVGALKTKCISKAVSDSSLTLNDPTNFITRCVSVFKEIRSSEKREFILFCATTYDGPRLIETLSDERCEIEWQPGANNLVYINACQGRTSLSDLVQNLGVPSYTEGLTDIFVRVNAHDLSQALEEAADRIDFFRGLLNYC